MEKKERGNNALLNRREVLRQLGGAAGMAIASRFLIGSKLANAAIQKENPENEPWRLESPEGPVYYWHPEDIGNIEETIIFVKGDGCTVKRTWNRDQLPVQFRSSLRKALFIAPETPIQGWKKPFTQPWGGNLDGLMDFVKTETGITPPGNITSIGHSAGYRTISTWLDHESIHTVILSDALYGRFGQYHQWAEKEGKKLAFVTPLKGAFTQERTANFLKRYRKRNGEETVLEFNGDLEHFNPERLDQNHKVISLRSSYSHRDQIRKGKVIPTVLQLMR